MTECWGPVVSTTPCFGGPGFRSWPQRLAILTEVLPGFRRTIQEDTRIVPQIKPHLLPIKFVTY